jgi:hypothetical protein
MDFIACDGKVIMNDKFGGMESDVAVSYSDVLPEHLTAARMAGL